MQADLLTIFLGIGCVLTLASASAFVLRLASRGPAADVANDLTARIRSWWWIIVPLSGAAMAGRWAVTALFAFTSFVALREFLTLTAIRAADRRVVLGIFLVALPSQYGLAAGGRFELFAGCLPIVALSVIPVLIALTGDTAQYLTRVSELVWGVMVCVYCISYVPALLMLRIPNYQGRYITLVLFFLLVTQGGDVLQYVSGKLLGRHQIAPELSPLKTREGLIGGVLSATALGAGMWRITPFSAVQAGAIAALLTLTGFLGGLVMSAIKRDRGVKDWSRFIPGHGGMLDRLDSIWLSAPVFFYLIRSFFAE